MKATGIVRRIDDLGRIVLPKEIRKTLRINCGDPIEIFVEKDEVLLKKYSPLCNVQEIAKDVCKSLATVSEKSVIILDDEKVVAAEGHAKDFLNDLISKEALKIISENKSFSLNEGENLQTIKLCQNDDGRFKSQLILPISNKNGNAIGLISLLDKDVNVKMTAIDIRLAKLASEFLLSKITI